MFFNNFAYFCAALSRSRRNKVPLNVCGKIRFCLQENQCGQKKAVSMTGKKISRNGLRETENETDSEREAGGERET